MTRQRQQIPHTGVYLWITEVQHSCSCKRLCSAACQLQKASLPEGRGVQHLFLRHQIDGGRGCSSSAAGQVHSWIGSGLSLATGNRKRKLHSCKLNSSSTTACSPLNHFWAASRDAGCAGLTGACRQVEETLCAPVREAVPQQLGFSHECSNKLLQLQCLIWVITESVCPPCMVGNK